MVDVEFGVLGLAEAHLVALSLEEIRAKPGRLGEARAVKTLRVQGSQVFASRKSEERF
jgi:hypothetical protein